MDVLRQPTPQPLLNCPHSAANAPLSRGARNAPLPAAGAEQYWQDFFTYVATGAQALAQGDYDTAKPILADALYAGTAGLAADPRGGFECSLGIAAAYHLLALTFCRDTRLSPGSWAFRRSLQIALRFMHLVQVWVTHVWEMFARRERESGGMGWYEASYIDDSAWPITIQELNVELTVVQNTLAQYGAARGHQPRDPAVHHTFRNKDLNIGIVSLCAYPPEHVLPKYAQSNHRSYAERHGYTYRVGLERADPNRPPAWGKIKLMYDAMSEPDVDWWLWFDCDTYFMNMSITLDSLLQRYGAATQGSASDKVGLDADFHMLVAEDHAMLNTGAFFLRSSEWSKKFLVDVWGADDSGWTDHPWWENAATLWNFLKDNSEKFRKGLEGPSGISEGQDEMDGIYPNEVRLAPQLEFNSYHPATSHFMHDTWEPGKFALAFNGVLSSTSPTVIRALYGNYYRMACELNGLQDKCEVVEEVLPWLRSTDS